MNKNRFLVDLEKSLTFMESEDRDAAIAYYNELFDEAGFDKEQSVLEELGSPAKVAVQLRREYAPEKPILTGNELSIPGTEEEQEASADGKTNTPWKGQLWRTGEVPPWNYGLNDLAGAAVEKQPEEDRQSEEDRQPKPGNRQDGEYSYTYRRAEETKSGTWHSPRQEPPKNAPPKQEPPKQEPGERSGPQEARKNPPGYNHQPVYENNKRKLPAWLIAIIVVCTLPISIPVAAVAFSLVIAMAAVFFALIASGIGIAIGGIAVVISGIFALSFLPDALMMFGVGAIMLAVGLLMAWFMIWLTAITFRGIFRAIRKKGGRTQ